MDENMKEYIPISSDTIKIYGFRFGRYRYQVEHFDHNKVKDVLSDDNSNILKSRDYWSTLHGTKVYQFLDWEFEQSVSTALYMDRYIEEDELKKMILDDVIDWKFEDPYDFKDLFWSRDDQMYCTVLFPREKERVEHNYPICEEPYEKCPICGGELDSSVLEIECAEDVFNSKGGYGPEGESWGEWDEIHRCPHCNKLFCIEMWT